MKDNKIPNRNPDFYIKIAIDVWANVWIENKKELGHDLIAQVELKDGENAIYAERYSNIKLLKERLHQRFENIRHSLFEAIVRNYAKQETKNDKLEFEKMESFLKNY